MKNMLAVCCCVLLLVMIGCEEEPAPVPAAPPSAPPSVPKPVPTPAPPLPSAGTNGAAADDAPPPATGEDVKREVNEAVSATGEYLSEKGDAWLAAAKTKLQELDARTAGLREQAAQKAEQVSTDAKQRWSRALESLEDERAAAKEKWEQLKAASGPKLEEAKSRLDAALQKAKSALADAEEELDNPGPASPPSHEP